MDINIKDMTKAQYDHWSRQTPSTRQAYAKEASKLELIDTETGEIKSGEYDLIPKGKPATPQQHRYKQREGDLADYTREQNGFVFTFYKLAEYVGNELKQADLARLLYIATFAHFGDNRLLHNGNHKVIDKNGLQTLLGLKDRAYHTFYKTVTELGIIKDRGYDMVMNSDYFYCGYLPKECKTGEIPYTRTYVKGIQELYKKYGTTRKIGQLGLLYLVIPYIHYDTNLLASNPDETDYAMIEPLPVEEIARILNYTPDKITKALTDIVLGNEFVFYPFGSGKEKYFAVNSLVFWRADSSPLNKVDTAQVLFAIKKRKKLLKG